MKKILWFLFFLCNAWMAHAQSHADVLQGVKSTMNDFVADLNAAVELETKDDWYRQSVENIGQTYGAAYFYFNNVDEESLTDWLFSYADQTLLSQPVTHDIQVLDKTLTKYNKDKDEDKRYRFDVILKRHWRGVSGYKAAPDERVTITVVWNGLENHVSITEISGKLTIDDFSSETMNILRAKFSGTYDWIYSFEGNYAVVQKDGLFGVIDRAGNEVVSVTYDNIGTFSEGLAIAVKQGKKCYVGIYNSIDGPFQETRPFRQGIAVVKTNGRYTCIDMRGNIILSQGYDEIRHDGNVLCVRLGERWGVFNTMGTQIIPVKYKETEYLGENRIRTKDTDKTVEFWTVDGVKLPTKNYQSDKILPEDAKIFHIGKFVNGYAPVGLQTTTFREYWGIIDYNGIFLLPPLYRGIYLIEDYTSAVVYNEVPYRNTYLERYALYNIEQKKFATDFNIQKIQPVYKDDFWIAMIEGKQGGINSMGETVIPFMDKEELEIQFDIYGVSTLYDGLELYDINTKGERIRYYGKGLYGKAWHFWAGIVEHPNARGHALRGADNEPCTPYVYNAIFRESKDIAFARSRVDNKWGLLNAKGECLAEPQYEACGTDFKNRSKNVYWRDIDIAKDDIAAWVKKDGKWGAVNAQGIEVIPVIYDDYRTFKSNKYADFISLYGRDSTPPFLPFRKKPMMKGCDYDNAITPVKLNGRWGYIDKTGKTAVPFIFSDAEAFNAEGLALVNKDGKLYHLTLEGKLLTIRLINN